MSHAINVQIGRAAELGPALSAAPFPGFLPLDLGFVLCPLAIGVQRAFREDPLDSGEAAAKALSAHGDVVYAETEYFGGVGGQAAVAYLLGERLFAARSPGDFTSLKPDQVMDWPINEALRVAFGLGPSGKRDAFDRLGLGRWRGMDELLPALGLSEDDW